MFKKLIKRIADKEKFPRSIYYPNWAPPEDCDEKTLAEHYAST